MSLPNPSNIAQSFAHDVWEEDYENASSPALIQAWTQLFSAYNDCINHNQSGLTPVKQTVFPLPTGTGKSQATLYYLANLKEHSALIITFFLEEAEKSIRGVKGFGGSANTYHSGNRLTHEQISSSRILFITHNQYLKALQDHDWLSVLNSYEGKPRSLFIIDENINQIEDCRFKDSDINVAISKISILMRKADLSDIEKEDLEKEDRHLENLKKLFQDAKNKISSKTGVRLTPEQEALVYKDIGKLKTIKDFISGERKDVLKRLDRTIKYDELNPILDALTSARNHKFAYLNKSGDDIYLNAVDYIAASQHHSVILDATAEVDHIYSLHNNVEVAKITEGIRRYDNVTLHLSPKRYRMEKKNLIKNADGIYNSIDELLEVHHPDAWMKGSNLNSFFKPN